MMNGGSSDLHRLREKENALKLPRRNASVEMKALPIVFLASPDQKLLPFNDDLDLIGGESSDSQRNAQARPL